MLKLNRILVLGVLAQLSACSSPQTHTLFSYPERQNVHGPSHSKRLVIAMISNLDNQVETINQTYYVTNDKTPRSLDVGGREIVANYVEAMREAFPKELVLISTGKIFNDQADQKVLDESFGFMKALRMDAIAYSSLSYSREHKKIIRQKFTHFPLVDSSSVNLKLPALRQNNPAHKVRIIERNNVKIAFLSVNLNKLNLDQDNPPPIILEDPVLAILKLKQQLKAQKVAVTILMADLSTQCTFPSDEITPIGSKQELVCNDPEDQLLKLIQRLPPDTIDLIASSNSSFANGQIEGIPVIQTQSKGSFIAWIELFFDTDTQTIAKERTYFHLPVKTCHQFFEFTKDCHIREDWISSSDEGIVTIKNNYDQFIPASFYDIQIGTEAQVPQEKSQEKYPEDEDPATESPETAQSI